MNKKPMGPVVNARVVELAQNKFGSSSEARDAIRKAIEAITDDQLRNVRGIHVLLMA